MIVRLVHRILLKKIFNKQVFMSLVTIKTKKETGIQPPSS